MRRRATYQQRDTPPRRPLARTGRLAGTVVAVGLFAGASSVVGMATAAPMEVEPRLSSGRALAADGRMTAVERRVAALERRMAALGAAASGQSVSSPSPAPSSATSSSAPTPFPRSAATASPSEMPSGPASSAPAASAAAGAVRRLFSADSPWNTPIPTGASTDPASEAIASQVLTNPALVVNVNLYEFAIPFQTATSSTPRVVLNGAAELGPVPLDPSWRPNNGADHKLNILDPATRTVFELQGFDPGNRSVQWAVKKDYGSSLADGYPADGRAGPTGSGLTQAGGVVRLEEIKAGRIDHALSFITSRPVNRFRYPASHSDGSIGGVGLEEGMRIQLDPSLDVDAIPGITPGEAAIAKALQRYGAYATDNGGGNNQAIGIYMEQVKPGEADPYPAAGFKEDWAQLRHIPRDKLRVLAADATPRPS